MKNDWTRSIWAKAGAFLLAVALVPVMLAYGAAFLFSYAGELDGGFYDGSLCKQAVYDRMHAAYTNWEYFDDDYFADLESDDAVIDGVTSRAELLERFEEWYSTDNEYTNVRFMIEAEDGTVLFDNHHAGDVEVMGWGNSFDDANFRTFVTRELSVRDNVYWAHELYSTILRLAPNALTVALLSLAAEIVLLVYLACVSARRAGREEAVAGWQEKIPLDLYLFLGGFAVVMLVLVAGEAVNGSWSFEPIFLAAVALCITAAWVFVLGFWMTLCARVKLGGWWKNTVILWTLRWCVRAAKWNWRAVCEMCRVFLGFVRALPLVWRTAVITTALVIFGAVFAREAPVLYVLLGVLLILAVCAFSMQLRRLQKGGEALAAGDLTAQVDTKRMYFDLRRHGENLNAISRGMSIAVERQLKSERMKTELITNVSHDIKTPLTSIVNYVDLLQREDTTPEQRAEYLAVLDRQAHKLKKLTVDLVEMSKASTGNLPCTIARRSVRELIDQAVGEYAERLSLARLEPVITLPNEELYCLCDGTLLWRVMDNLLSNVCKYACPGTRVYIGARRAGGTVEFSFKNISRDALNIPPEELMERFVRGDSARASEGSGLGLNIAKSLVELQKGGLSLAIDGDLFKISFVLPRAE